MKSSLDPYKVKADFPFFTFENATYLDSACMALKPRQVIAEIEHYYHKTPVCAGRSSHRLGEQLTENLRRTRIQVQNYIHASRPSEIIFTRNTTESINIVASGITFKEGDEVLISDKEHNSNLLPWVRLQNEKKIRLVICPTCEDNTFSIEEFQKRLSPRTRLVSLASVSNLDGVEIPVKELTKRAHAISAEVLIDAAQQIPHGPLNVRELDVDYLAFSGHKMMGPTGTGVLYVKEKKLGALRPLCIGGGTVQKATYDNYLSEKGPARFEAGLQDYAGILGLGKACEYMQQFNSKEIQEHIYKLNAYATQQLTTIPGITIIGPSNPAQRTSIVAFTLSKIDSLTIADLLSKQGVFVRAGAHCVHSWFASKNLAGSVRLSFAIYNTLEDIDRCLEALKKIAKLQ